VSPRRWTPLSKAWFAAIALVVSVGLASGCGYTWAGSDTALGSVAVRTPQNDSIEAGLEFVVADALRREVLRRSGATLVEDPSSADWVVSGRVLPVRVEPASLSPVVLTLEYQLTLTLDLRARTSEGREVVGTPRDMRESELYLSSSDIEAERKNRGEALQRVSRLLAARFLDQLGEEGT
jgi:Lipopolysaccharide-assembly